MRAHAVVAGAVLAALLAGCAVGTTSAPPASGRTDAPSRPVPTTAKKVDPAQVERLKKTMLPLLAAMNKPPDPGQVKVGIMDDPSINAANAGNGEFFVTTGLIVKANDEQLRAVLAHEVAHEDLGHVAKAQALGTGIGIGAVILDQIIPGAGQVAPIAGALITRSYSRSEEYAADRHGVDLLKRIGRPKEDMINTLTWLMASSGSDGGGGFLSTHPATEDRIDVLRKL